ncbi:hypothetical protein ROTO_06510 [Roseovarius tolerans]|jgi:uncharacterized membrane protein YphA (DoxX/SURF4 family)|uniref:Uncharacterized protein n=1 Tax=Roseovarius tolerans TaxID=74031 RepID=A0A0L6CYK9_9RHOB|nr:hypothetical protein [Roseovarius tolerans]KNX42801.1 hypothetical protein ROTO_06510 [Roseovarius tolerans]
MIQAFGTAGLLSRLYLAAFFASHVTHALAPGALKTWTGTTTQALHTGDPWMDIAVAALLSLVVIWLALGVHSRIVALIGFVICTATVILHGDTWINSARVDLWTWPHVTALLAVVILAITGGGTWRLYSGGWRVRHSI